MNNISDEKVKDLASIYDMQDTFISLYLDVSRGINWKFIDRRRAQCESALKGDKILTDAFRKNMDKLEVLIRKEINEDIARNRYRGVAIFISEPMKYFEGLGFPHTIKNSMIVDTSPYIRPLAQMIDEWETYAIVLIDTNEARMYDVSLGAMKDKKKLTAYIMNKHKKGGWSQMRFQRLRREAIEQFQKKVVESLDVFIKSENVVGIVLAGPGEAKLHFKKELPQHLKKMILTEIDYQMDLPAEKLVETTTQEVAKIEREVSDKAVEKLKGEILKGGLAVFGINETVKATREGKAEVLILSKELKPRGWICEHCQVVEVGVKKLCPYCNNKTSEVDVLEEILEFAERAGTHIEFVGNNPMLEDLGGVGALLRY